MVVNKYDPSRHRLIDTEQTRFLRRELRMEDLFTILFPETGTWSIAVWTDKGRGEFVEKIAIRDIRELDKATVWDLRAWASHQTETVGEQVRRIQARTREEERKAQEDEAEARDSMRFCGERFKRKFGNMVTERSTWDLPSFPVQFGPGKE